MVLRGEILFLFYVEFLDSCGTFLPLILRKKLLPNSTRRILDLPETFSDSISSSLASFLLPTHNFRSHSDLF